MIAEGGTHRRHMVTMARSRAATGPFDSYDKNPLITGVPGTGVTCVGHADLVDDAEGNWWALLLARRELGERSDSYPLGRETYMVPVEWPEGEFPVFEPVQLQHSVPASRGIIGAKSASGQAAPVLLSSGRTLYIRDPVLGNYSAEGAAITLRLTDVELGAMEGSPTFVGERQISLASTASAQVDLVSVAKAGVTGVAVYKDPFRYAAVEVDLSAGQVSFVLRHATQEHTVSALQSLAGATAARLKIESTVENYSFSYSALVGEEWTAEAELSTIACREMSGDDFTGWCSRPCKARWRLFLTKSGAQEPSAASTRPAPMARSSSTRSRCGVIRCMHTRGIHRRRDMAITKLIF